MKNKIQNFMQGRYGVDKLGQHMMFLSLGLMLLGLVPGMFWTQWIAFAMFIWIYFRLFSKKFSKRYEENRKYTNFIWGIEKFFKRRIRKIKNFFTKLFEKRKYKHVNCTACHQTMRVPKGKGNLTLTCPKCKNKQNFTS